MRCHVSHGPGPRLLAKLSSGAATRYSAPDLASLPRWAQTLPRGLGPRLLAELSSGAVTCSSIPNLASLSRWAPALSHVHGSGLCLSERRAPALASLSRWAPALPRGSGLASPRGELRCCHVPHGPQQAVDLRNKERTSCPRHAAGLACVQSMVAYYRGGYKACGHAATVRFNSATQTQLTIPGHGYSDDTTRQDATTGRARFSAAE
jgi:hypothetical protein